MSKLSTLEFLAGISLVQIVITFISVILTFAAAVVLGFKSAGSYINMFVISLIACISIMAISLIVSAFLKTIFDLMTVGCFPFFILMFFSGGLFPMPGIKLFNIGDHAFNITDVLPTSHAVSALNKIMNFGYGLQEVSYEISAMIILTIIYFALGVTLFKKRQMKIG